MTETFTLLHGTTAKNAAFILKGGFRASDPRTAAEVVGEAFGLEPFAIWTHGYYAFPRSRPDLDRVHFTTNPWKAVAFCATGACLRVGVDAAVLYDALEAAGLGRSLVSYNDFPGRTKYEVAALFDHAKEQPL